MYDNATIKSLATSPLAFQLQALVDRAMRKYGAGSEHAVKALQAYDKHVYGL